MDWDGTRCCTPAATHDHETDPGSKALPTPPTPYSAYSAYSALLGRGAGGSFGRLRRLGWHPVVCQERNEELAGTGDRQADQQALAVRGRRHLSGTGQDR